MVSFTHTGGTFPIILKLL